MRLPDDLDAVIRARHSVRHYLNRPIEPGKAKILSDASEELSRESGLSLRLVVDEPEVFCANRPHYGSFSGCRNYFVLFGEPGRDEAIGYYGEKLVLLAQSEGLNTCWVALTFEKKMLTIDPPAGMKLYDVIALGYGETQGTPHRSKPAKTFADLDDATPEWFRTGLEYAMLAPTAINQQRFRFERIGEHGVRAKALFGPCSKTDLGIVKLHFELGAGVGNFDWI